MKILIPTDGSKPALHAVKYAIALVGSLSSTSNAITLISVHDDVALRHARAVGGKEAIANYLHERSEKELKPAIKLLGASHLEFETEIRTGHVAAQIVDFARAGKFDLIVLGAKGRGAIADLLLGSVAQRVMATAEMPVTLVK